MIDLQNINFETFKVYYVWAQQHSTLEWALIKDGNDFKFDFEIQFGILFQNSFLKTLSLTVVSLLKKYFAQRLEKSVNVKHIVRVYVKSFEGQKRTC